MKIRKYSRLVDMYAGPHHPILANSPEFRFIELTCAGMAEEAAGLFRERKLFGGSLPVVDAPHGRFEGLDGIRRFAETWLSVFHAQSAFVTPAIQTRANGRSVTELIVNFVVDGEIEQVPMFVIGDLRTADSLDEVRIYTHCSFVPGLTPYRKPMFQSAHLEMGDPDLLTGAVREYYDALHHTPKADVDRIMGAMGERCQFGGYEPWGAEEHPQDKAWLRKEYERMALYIPRCVGMRYETIIDDGRTGVIEWVHIVSEAGRSERGRICMSGIAAYERGDDGLLCSIRISDYAGLESGIDWSQTPVIKEEALQRNMVNSFSSGCGNKRQPQ